MSQPFPFEQPVVKRDGKDIPVIAFFGAKGGVGKTTIARTIAELVTAASDRDNRHPNVLAVDLDVDHRGLTVLMASNIFHRCPTVHDLIAGKNAMAADAVDVSSEVSLRSGTMADRGKLYLMPSAPKEASNVFSVIASIDLNELLNLLNEMVQHVVDKYHISCVIFDCGPIVNPYTAAATEIATGAFIIGQNEPITYQSIGVQATRIQEMYPQFTSSKMKIIINKVRGLERLNLMKSQMEIFFHIPLTVEVIDASEGVANVSELRMLLLENYMIELVRKILIGYPDLVPKPHVLLTGEWKHLLNTVNDLDGAPKMKRLRLMTHLLWPGVLTCALALAIFVFGVLTPKSPPADTSSVAGSDAGIRRTSIASLVIAPIGLFLFGVGVYGKREQKRLRQSIRQVQEGGADWLFTQLKGAESARARLTEISSLARSLTQKS